MALSGQVSRTGCCPAEGAGFTEDALLAACALAPSCVSCGARTRGRQAPFLQDLQGDSTGCTSALAHHRSTCVPKARAVSLPRCVTGHGLCQKHEPVYMGWTPGGQLGGGGEVAHGDSHRGARTHNVHLSDMEQPGTENVRVGESISRQTYESLHPEWGGEGCRVAADTANSTRMPLTAGLPDRRVSPATGGSRGHVYKEHRG